MSTSVHRRLRVLSLIGLVTLLLAACGGAPAAQPTTAPAATTDTPQPTIVVTYSVLGSVVRELVGDTATVIVSMPNGQDPHEWEPSAKDIETIMKADLVVQNGLGLEGGMEKTLAQAQAAGVRFFTASEHITIRTVGAGEGLPTGDPDQAVGAEDPHLWMDPLAMKAVVAALATQMKTDLGLDLGERATSLETRLDTLNTEIAAEVAKLPEARRKLVTGHESLGYFAQRYAFTLVGAIIPAITSQAEVSAADLASLKQLITTNQVPAIFTELGTPPQVAQAIGQEAGVKVVELTTHNLPDD
ncbi:MAG: zinc ABC transporter substrate-binding protein, partial [Oscillochloris sp.]|nr:zinc ABC transporter substrate-binding protein [Oscillochloris sp.]